MGLYKEEGGCITPPHGRTVGDDVMYFNVLSLVGDQLRVGIE